MKVHSSRSAVVSSRANCGQFGMVQAERLQWDCPSIHRVAGVIDDFLINVYKSQNTRHGAEAYGAVVPKSQKAAQTRGSAPSKTAFSRARYTAQEDAGEPGMGRRGMGNAEVRCLTSRTLVGHGHAHVKTGQADGRTDIRRG